MNYILLLLSALSLNSLTHSAIQSRLLAHQARKVMACYTRQSHVAHHNTLSTPFVTTKPKVCEQKVLDLLHDQDYNLDQPAPEIMHPDMPRIKRSNVSSSAFAHHGHNEIESFIYKKKKRIKNNPEQERLECFGPLLASLFGMGTGAGLATGATAGGAGAGVATATLFSSGSAAPIITAVAASGTYVTYKYLTKDNNQSTGNKVLPNIASPHTEHVTSQHHIAQPTQVFKPSNGAKHTKEITATQPALPQTPPKDITKPIGALNASAEINTCTSDNDQCFYHPAASQTFDAAENALCYETKNGNVTGSIGNQGVNIHATGRVGGIMTVGYALYKAGKYIKDKCIKRKSIIDNQEPIAHHRNLSQMTSQERIYHQSLFQKALDLNVSIGELSLQNNTNDIAILEQVIQKAEKNRFCALPTTKPTIKNPETIDPISTALEPIQSAQFAPIAQPSTPAQALLFSSKGDGKIQQKKHAPNIATQIKQAVIQNPHQALGATSDAAHAISGICDLLTPAPTPSQSYIDAMQQLHALKEAMLQEESEKLIPHLFKYAPRTPEEAAYREILADLCFKDPYLYLDMLDLYMMQNPPTYAAYVKEYLPNSSCAKLIAVHVYGDSTFECGQQLPTEKQIPGCGQPLPIEKQKIGCFAPIVDYVRQATGCGGPAPMPLNDSKPEGCFEPIPQDALILAKNHTFCPNPDNSDKHKTYKWNPKHPQQKADGKEQKEIKNDKGQIVGYAPKNGQKCLDESFPVLDGNGKYKHRRVAIEDGKYVILPQDTTDIYHGYVVVDWNKLREEEKNAFYVNGLVKNKEKGKILK